MAGITITSRNFRTGFLSTSSDTLVCVNASVVCEACAVYCAIAVPTPLSFNNASAVPKLVSHQSTGPVHTAYRDWLQHAGVLSFLITSVVFVTLMCSGPHILRNSSAIRTLPTSPPLEATDQLKAIRIPVRIPLTACWCAIFCDSVGRLRAPVGSGPPILRRPNASDVSAIPKLPTN